MKQKSKRGRRRLVSGVMAALLLVTAMPSIPVKAQETEGERYPYTVFAGSYEEGAITVNAGNFCINGSVATNGTIVASGNMNINGEKKEAANEEMIYIPGKLEASYFASENVEIHTSDYNYEETNIHINNPIDVEGSLSLIGNVNINSSVRAEEDIVLTGEVKNAANSVIYSETGDISIEGNNVNLTGLLYAPYGEIVLTAQNMNLNSVIIIGDKVVFDCPNVNANYDSRMAQVVGTVSEEKEDVSGGDTSGGDSGENSGGSSTEETPGIDEEKPSEDVSGGDISGGDISGGINTVTMLYAVGEYNANTNSVDIEWYSDGNCSGYEILSSDDGEKYTSVAKVSEGTTYQYQITEAFEEKYFKVSTVSGQGKEVESLPFSVCRFEDGYGVMYTDSDGDGLEDVFELALGLDIYEQDTDKDTLTDFQEFCLVGTNPAIYDSVSVGISDAEADADGDGLTTVQEMTHGTDSRNEDTDNDALTDYEEVVIYQANPLKWDTDGDTLSDSEELAIGLDPNNPQTHGVPDAEYQVKQSIDAGSEVLATINTPDSPYQLSVDIAATGNAEEKLNIRISSYAAAIENDFMLGEAPELFYAKDGQVGSVTLKFEIEESYVDAGLGMFPGEEEMEGIKRFNVFRYFEDAHMLLPVATEFDVENNCVCATVDELGTYCVMDMELWLNSFEVPEEVYQESVLPYALRTMSVNTLSINATDASVADATTDKTTITAAKPIEAVFMLQSAGVQPSVFAGEKTMIVNLLGALTESYGEKVKFSVIVFDASGAEVLTNSFGKVWFTDADELNKKLSAVNYRYTYEEANRGDAYVKGNSKVPFSRDSAKFVTMMMTGNALCGAEETTILSKWIDQGIHYSEIYPMFSNYVSSEYWKVIANIIKQSEGLKMYYSSGTYQTFFEHMCKHAEKKDEVTPEATKFSVIVPTGWKEIVLDGPISLSSGTNSDTDALSDYREIDVRQLKWDANGNAILPTISEAWGGYSPDGLDRFKSEQWAAGMPSTAFEKRFDYILNNTRILPILSDPTTPDTDGDGLDDAQEQEYKTDPFTIDTDLDMLDDEEEVSLGLNPLYGDSDGDGLFDAFELELWYDPLDANPDGDEYNDQEEYYRGSDPYTYEVEVEVKDPSGQFWKGVVFGDFVEDEEVDGYVLVGQIASGFVPVVADGRDVVANVSKGDFLMAILSGAGFFPGLGDAAKGIGDLGQVIVKLADDTPTIARLLIKTADEHPYLVRLFGESAIVKEALEEALNNPKITKESYEKLVKTASEAGFDSAIVKLSKTKTDHILKNHTFGRMKNNIDKMMEKGLQKNAENLLNEKSFFNPTWSEEKVIEAAILAYNDAISKGCLDGTHTVVVFGENVSVYLENGVLHTAFGEYRYTLKDFGY